jgi:hypothetical protein
MDFNGFTMLNLQCLVVCVDENVMGVNVHELWCIRRLLHVVHLFYFELSIC